MEVTQVVHGLVLMDPDVVDHVVWLHEIMVQILVGQVALEVQVVGIKVICEEWDLVVHPDLKAVEVGLLVGCAQVGHLVGHVHINGE